MDRLTKRIDLGNEKYTVDFSNERCGEFLTDHKAGVRALFNKLVEYEDLEEQGLLIRLPCKVGDIVYEIAGYCWDCGEQTSYCHLNCKKPKYRIRKWNVEYFEIGCTLRLHGRCGKSGIFNKTVFLTEEEAAAELERVDKK